VKNERLFAIVNHLLTRGRTGARELAQRFEVSRRTIYRDLDSLSASGVPVLAVPGAGGGFELESGFRIDRSFLTGDELADLTGAIGGFAEALKSRPLERSLDKLAGLGSRRRSAVVEAKGRRAEPGTPPCAPLVVRLTPWGGPSPSAHLVEALRAAVNERCLVELRYRDAQGAPSERVVEPFSMVLGGAVWYLHAFCRLRGAFRLFKLARIADVQPLDERFDPWARAPVPDPFDIEDVAPLVDVVLEVKADALAQVREALGYAQFAAGAAGTVNASFRAPDDGWLLGQLLALGRGVRVIEPDALRARVHAAATAVARANARTRPKR
jgi:predicted DNA-binding transcriptional regulator YafY